MDRIIVRLNSASLEDEWALVKEWGSTANALPVIAGSAVAFTLLMFLGRFFSSLLVGDIYRSLPRRKQLDWDSRVVSSVFATIITFGALQVLDNRLVANNPVFAFDHFAHNLYAVATGYFVWDTALCLVNIRTFGLSFLVHGIVCFGVYFFVLRPFLTYYAAVFLLYEISTIFLNINFFLEQAGMTNSVVHFANGILLLASFFLSRLVFGTYTSYHFFIAVWSTELRRVPLILAVFYSLANVILNSLNFFWFYKMIRRTFRPRRTATDKDGAVKGANGAHTAVNPKKSQ